MPSVSLLSWSRGTNSKSDSQRTKRKDVVEQFEPWTIEAEDFLQELYPNLDLTSDIDPKSVQIDEASTSHNSFFQIYKAWSHSEGAVVLQKLRLPSQTDYTWLNEHYRSLRLWVQLRDHRNVQRLLGYYIDECALSHSVFVQLIPGTLRTLMNEHHEVDVLFLIEGIASGLQFLHSQDVVYADLHADNILISFTGIPILAYSIRTRTHKQIQNMKPHRLFAAEYRERWSAPETFSKAIRTKETDIWTFGMLGYEMLSKKIPFYHVKSDAEVIRMITGREGTAPLQPHSCEVPGTLKRAFWEICEDCWNRDPKARPTAADVQTRVTALIKQYDLCSSENFWDTLRSYAGELTHDENIDMEDELITASLPNLADDITLQSCHEFAGGSQVAVYKAKSREYGSVAVRQPRIHAFKENLQKFRKVFIREFRIWQRLRHPNVLQLRGYIPFQQGFKSSVARWFPLGSVSGYMREKRSEKGNHLPLTKGIASALAYLHGIGVVHADLKADNILLSLISENGAEKYTPVLTDFGLSHMMVSSTVLGPIATEDIAGTTRWFAPEILEVYCPQNEKTDIWALGMVIYELLTRDIPYANLKNEPLVLAEILDRRLPKRPASTLKKGSLEEAFWNLSLRCWHMHPSARPSSAEVKRIVRQILKSCVDNCL